MNATKTSVTRKPDSKSIKKKTETFPDIELPEIDPDEQLLEKEDPGLGFIPTKMTYDEMEDRIPMVAGSFTGWRYRKMRLLNEWTRELDQDPPDILQQVKWKGIIRSRVQSVDELTETELAHYKLAESEVRKQYFVKWATYFSKYLNFKKPFIINGAQFNNLDQDLENPIYDDSDISEFRLNSAYSKKAADDPVVMKIDS